MGRLEINNKKNNLIKFKSSKDKRGEFSRIYCFKELKKIDLNKIAQVNIVKTKKKGTIRGFHYQVGKFSEDKLIIVLKGSIFDVFINLNKNKKDYLKINKKKLYSSKKEILFIPKGYAHAYQTLQDNTHILYLTTNFYNDAKEKQFNPLSNFFNIEWPVKKMTLSKKDLNSNFYEKK